MNDCQNYILKMNQYLDGELPVEEISDLLRHIEGCGECRRRFDLLKVTVFETRHLRVDPPAGLHDSIMRRIAAQRPVRRRRRLGQFAALAACGALLIVMSSTVTPWLRNMPLFGVMPPGENTSSAAGGSAAPEAAENQLRTAEGNKEAYPQDYALGSSASASGTEADGSAGGENAPEKAASDAPGGGMMPVSGYNHTHFTVPELGVSEQVAFYIVAAGGGDVAGLFPVEAIISGSEGREDYIFISNTAEAKEEAEQLLIAGGFTLYDNVDNLPQTDEGAEHGLVIVFESR